MFFLLFQSTDAKGLEDGYVLIDDRYTILGESDIISMRVKNISLILLGVMIVTSVILISINMKLNHIYPTVPTWGLLPYCIGYCQLARY